MVAIAVIVSEHLGFHRDGLTDGRTNSNAYRDSTVDADSDYIYFVGSAAPPSVCYIDFRLAQS